MTSTKDEEDALSYLLQHKVETIVKETVETIIKETVKSFADTIPLMQDQIESFACAVDNAARSSDQTNLMIRAVDVSTSHDAIVVQTRAGVRMFRGYREMDTDHLPYAPGYDQYDVMLEEVIKEYDSSHFTPLIRHRPMVELIPVEVEQLPCFCVRSKSGRITTYYKEIEGEYRVLDQD